jgi:hypothetical protein
MTQHVAKHDPKPAPFDPLDIPDFLKRPLPPRKTEPNRTK